MCVKDGVCVCVTTLYVTGRRRREREEERDTESKTRTPHTKMWGKTIQHFRGSRMCGVLSQMTTDLIASLKSPDLGRQLQSSWSFPMTVTVRRAPDRGVLGCHEGHRSLGKSLSNLHKPRREPQTISYFQQQYHKQSQTVRDHIFILGIVWRAVGIGCLAP